MPRIGKGKSKGRPARLSLRITIESVPPGTTRRAMREVLLASVRSGRYDLPAGWIATLHWRNNAEWRRDEWTNAMIDSSAYSRGWDKVIEEYIKRAI